MLLPLQTRLPGIACLLLSISKVTRGVKIAFFKLTCSGFIFKLKDIEHFQLKFCYALAS